MITSGYLSMMNESHTGVVKIYLESMKDRCVNDTHTHTIIPRYPGISVLP